MIKPLRKDLELHEVVSGKGDNHLSFRTWGFVKMVLILEVALALTLPLLLQNYSLRSSATRIDLQFCHPFGLKGIIDGLNVNSDYNDQIALFGLVVKMYNITLPVYLLCRVFHSIVWKDFSVNTKLMHFSTFMFLVSMLGLSLGVTSGKGMYELSTRKPLAINLAEVLIL